MNKNKRKFVSSIVYTEIFLMVMTSVAVAFIINSEIVSAERTQERVNRIVETYMDRPDMGEYELERIKTEYSADADKTIIDTAIRKLIARKVILGRADDAFRELDRAGGAAPIPTDVQIPTIKEVKKQLELQRIRKDLPTARQTAQTSLEKYTLAQKAYDDYLAAGNAKDARVKKYQDLLDARNTAEKEANKLRKQYDKLVEQEKELSGTAETPEGEKKETEKGESPGSILTGLYAGKVFGKYGSYGTGPLIAGAAWGFSVALGLKALEGFLGVKKETIETLQISVLAGSLGGGAIKSIFELAGKKTIGKYSTKAISQFAGAAIAIGVFLATYKKEKVELVTFTSLPWQPPTGGRY